MPKFPFFKQLDQSDCGPTCLKIIAAHFGKQLNIEQLRKDSKVTREGTSFYDLSETAENLGFKTLAIKTDFKTLAEEVTFPCIVHWNQKHFIVVYKIDKKFVFAADPAHGLIKYTKEEFLKGWIGKDTTLESYALLVETTSKFYEQESNASSNIGFDFLFFYLKPYKRYIVQLIIGLAFGSLLQLILPFLTQSVVDYGINYQNLHFVYIILLAQVTLFLSQATVDIIRAWILLHVTSRINISLISDFLRKLMRLPISFFDSKNTGDIFQRISDHNRVQGFLSNTTLTILFSAFNVVIFGAVLAYYSLAIFSIFFIGSLCYLGWTVLFLKKRKELDYKRFIQAADNQNSLVQLIAGMQELKLNGSERRRRWEWEAIQVRLFKVSIKGLTLSQTQMTGGMIMFQLQNIFITFIAVKSVITGDITLGAMLSIQYIIGQLSAPINSFIGFIQAAQDAKISLERMSEIHGKPEEDAEILDDQNQKVPDMGIIMHDMSFTYGSQTSALTLSSLNFEIPQGKVTAIVGPSGSGKTTFLKLLLKFYDPSKGEIRVENVDLKDINSKQWRKHCGVVMQDGFIFNDTILRNITESDSESVLDKKRLQQAVKIANIEEFIKELPLGYNTKIGSSGSNISGGQRQRILIARAVYKNPSYIFFDEATSSLDSENESIIMQNLQEFYSGRTVVIVAHRLSTVKNAAKIIVLNKGKVVEMGSHNELVELQGFYFNLIRNQIDLEAEVK